MSAENDRCGSWRTTLDDADVVEQCAKPAGHDGWHQNTEGHRFWLQWAPLGEAQKPGPVVLTAAEVAQVREALDAWQTLNVDCFVNGEVAPRDGCECNTCETWREGERALALLDRDRAAKGGGA